MTRKNFSGENFNYSIYSRQSTDAANLSEVITLLWCFIQNYFSEVGMDGQDRQPNRERKRSYEIKDEPEELETSPAKRNYIVVSLDQFF